MTEPHNGNLAVRCSGCGVHLQTENSELPGLSPRRHWIVNRLYASAVSASKTTMSHHPLRWIRTNSWRCSKIGDKDALVIHIVDLFDFDGSIISGLQRFVGNNPVLLAVNKTDLLPKVTNWNKVRNWVQKQAKEQGLRTVDVVLCSAKQNQGFDRLLELVGTYREDRDVYVVGGTNVGKSTLINRLIRDYSDLEQELTTSRYPGTTLDMVNIPLDDGKYIIDTPGIVYPWRFSGLFHVRISLPSCRKNRLNRLCIS